MSDHRMQKGGRLASLLLVGIGLVGCGPLATPLSVTLTASVIPTVAAPSATMEPTRTEPAPSPTRAAATSTPASAPLTPATLKCEAGEQWRQTQSDLTLIACFEPYPPRLGILTVYEAILVDSTGQPVLDATVELTMVGGMAAMEGEHDEDFSTTLAGQGMGLYSAEVRVGPTDLVLTEVRVVVRHDRQSWTFSIPADKLSPP